MKTIYTERKNKYIEYFQRDDMILDIQTTTRFWRTSQILSAEIITEDSGMARCIRFMAEKEADEYDILLELSALIRKTDHIYTFNGRSFDLPHLKKKYEAYRIKSPFDSSSHTDLLWELKKYDSYLSLPSHRLTDYYALVSLEPFPDSEVWAAYEILPLLSLRSFTEGNFNVREIRTTDSGSAVCFVLDCDLPCRIYAETEFFEISGDREKGTITAKLDHGNLRMYHTDYSNYVFLPLEGYAVHKTLASYIASSRKVAADRESCYSFIPFHKKFTENPEKVKKYLLSVLRFISES